MDVSGQIQAPDPLHMWAWNRRLSGLQSWYGRFEEEKESPSLPEIDSRTAQSVAWSLYRVLFT
jgi:hypothetical protein